MALTSFARPSGGPLYLMIASAKPRASAPLLGEMSPCVPLAKIDVSG